MKITRRGVLPVMAGAGVALSGAIPGLDLKPANAEDLSTLMEPGPLGEHIVGDPNAPITVIEYASMTCPHCKNWHEQVYPTIKEKYLDTGRAKLYFREFPFDPASVAAFMLAECSDDRYFSMVDVLFKRQATWKSGNVRDNLEKIAKLAGFTQESFEACLKNQELLDNIVSIQQKAAKDYEVNATPTFFINGTKYSGSLSVEQMSEILDSLS